MNVYISNAFSLQMLKGNATVNVKEVKSIPHESSNDSYKVISAIGHEDTARVLGLPCNRINISLDKGDVLYVAQLMGGRLPEGSTTLPDGFMFKYYRVEII